MIVSLLGFFAKRRVRNGADFFDKNIPVWAGLIPKGKVEMSSRYSCLLGKLYGSFPKGLDNLNLSVKEAIDFGLMPTLLAPASLLTLFYNKELRARRVMLLS